MIRLIQYLSLRHARRHASRTLLTICGVALGVAVVIAIQTVNHTILESFRRMIDSIAGRATLQVSAGEAGVPEDLWEKIEKLPYVKYVTPVVQQTAKVPQLGNETILILGIDFTGDEKFRDYRFSKNEGEVDDPLAFLNDPNAVLASEDLARRHHLTVGDSIQVMSFDRTEKLRVRGLLKAEGPARAFGGSFMMMDIFAAQALWGKEGKFDRYDIITSDELPIATAKEKLKSALGNAYKVEFPRQRGDSAQSMLASFQTGLNMGGFVALMVGLFMIYNTMQISVTQRRREISIARALGAKRSDIILLFIGEALVLGTLASFIGLFGGLFIGRGMLASVSQSVSAIFLKVNPEDIYVSPWVLFFGMLSGMGSSVIAAFGPARLAASVTPVEGLRFEGTKHARTPTWKSLNAKIAYVLALLCAIFWVAAPHLESIYWGYSAQFSSVLMFAFIAPTLIASIWPRIQPIARRILGPPERLAFDNLPRQVSRAAVTLSAIMMGFAMVVEIDNYLGSFKRTVQRWVNQSIPAQIYVTSGSKLAHMDNRSLKEDLDQEMAKWPEVEAIDKVRIVDVDVNGIQIPLLSNISEIYLAHVQRDFLSGNIDEARKRLNHEPSVLISNNFERRFHYHLGDLLPLQTTKGIVKVPIIGVIEDYISDRGLLIMGRAPFIQFFDDRLVDSFDLYLRDKSKVEEVRQRVLSTVGKKFELFALTNEELKTEVFRVIDETYRIIKVMELIAVIVAVLGVINTLLASVLEKTREIGVLRALGATRKQVARMVTAEGSYLAIGGMLLGFLLGILLTQIIFTVIIPQATGWRFALRIAYGRIFAGAIAGLLLSFLASYFPARVASRLNVVKAIEYE